MDYLNYFINNPGLIHLTEHIFAHLDSKSLAKCREVSKSWKNFIDNSYILIGLQLRQCIFKSRISTWDKENEAFYIVLKRLSLENQQIVLNNAKKMWIIHYDHTMNNEIRVILLTMKR